MYMERLRRLVPGETPLQAEYPFSGNENAQAFMWHRLLDQGAEVRIICAHSH
jgi:uncharacterized protein (DUF1810 family)